MTAELVEKLLAGDRRALARALTLVERGGAPARAIGEAVWPRTGEALRIGVTGAPGVGKSTLVDALAGAFKTKGPVGILAVDPSSAFSKGALLGDRIRMGRSAADDAIFIRSMANRGRLGGLAPTTCDAADVLDAYGCRTVFLETVGVGQAEIEVAFAADVTLVVLAPGAGDGVQALKAGLMEIADVFCVNKGDLDGANAVKHDVEAAAELATGRDSLPPVVVASARGGTGVDELIRTLESLEDGLRSSAALETRRRAVITRRLEASIAERAFERAARRVEGRPELLDAVCSRRKSVSAAAEELLEETA